MPQRREPTPPPPPAPPPSKRGGAGGPFEASLAVHQDRAEIDEVVRQVTSATEACGFPNAASFAVRLALEEAVSNAFRHGHRGLDQNVPIRVRYAVSPTRVELVVTDQGPGFRPSDVPDPTLEENLERPSGRGLMLMRSYMSRVEYSAKGNEVRMEFVRRA